MYLLYPYPPVTPVDCSHVRFHPPRYVEPQVGLLDVDICGPSVPRMLGLTGQEVHQSSSGWSPVWVNDGLGVMSIGFMLPQQDNAVIWRGPKKNGLIKQFLTVRLVLTDTPPPGWSIASTGREDCKLSDILLQRSTY